MATHGEKRWPPAGRFNGRLRGAFHGHRQPPARSQMSAPASAERRRSIKCAAFVWGWPGKRVVGPLTAHHGKQHIGAVTIERLPWLLLLRGRAAIARTTRAGRERPDDEVDAWCFRISGLRVLARIAPIQPPRSTVVPVRPLTNPRPPQLRSQPVFWPR